MKLSSNLKIIIGLSIYAILLSSYLTYLHYSEDTSSFCDISPSLSCDIVNKSKYSEFFGIPIAIMGGLTFIIIIIASLLALKNKKIKIFGKNYQQKHFLNIILILLVVSILFALYLIYIELFVLYSICILCVNLDFIILFALIFIIKAKRCKK